MPLLGLLVIDEGFQVREYPVVAVWIHDDVIGLTGLTPVLDHISVLPSHLTRLWIHTDEFTVAGGHQQHTVPVGHRREVEFLGQQTFLVAVLGQCVFLSAIDIAVEPLVVGLHPEIFLGVDVEAVDTADDTVFCQLFGGIPHGTLGHWVEQ